MRITPRILALAIPLLLIGCAKWGRDKAASRAVDLYPDVQEVFTQDTIPSGTVCRIDQRLSAGKVFGFHKIECQNGQSGYLMLGGDEAAFDPEYQHRNETPNKKASRSVALYPDIERTAMPDTIPSGTICRINRRSSMRKIYFFHKIECQNGQSGYLLREDQQAFLPTHSVSAPKG
jgi:hypothetical protein